jgi:hypothetical protein
VFLYYNYEIASMKVCHSFLECSTYFIIDDLILLFVAFRELLVLAYVFFSSYEIIRLFVFSCRTLI